MFTCWTHDVEVDSNQPKAKTSGVQNVDCKAFLTDFLVTLKCKYNHA